MSVTGVADIRDRCDCRGCNVTAFVPANNDSPCNSDGDIEKGGIVCVNPDGAAPGFFAWQVDCHDNQIKVTGRYSLIVGQSDLVEIARYFPKGTSCADIGGSGNDSPFPGNPIDFFCEWSSAVLTMIPVLA